MASCWAAGTRRTHWVLTPGLSSWFKQGGDPTGGAADRSHLKGDVVELAAAAGGRSARVDHAVHRNEPRAAPRGSPGPFPGRAPRRGAAGGSFAFNSLLARHLTRFPNELLQTLPKICARLEWKSCRSSHLRRVGAALLFASGLKANPLLLWLLLCHFLLVPGAQDQCAPERCGAKRHLERKAPRTQ